MKWITILIDLMIIASSGKRTITLNFQIATVKLASATILLLITIFQ